MNEKYIIEQKSLFEYNLSKQVGTEKTFICSSWAAMDLKRQVENKGLEIQMIRK